MYSPCLQHKISHSSSTDALVAENDQAHQRKRGSLGPAPASHHRVVQPSSIIDPAAPCSTFQQTLLMFYNLSRALLPSLTSPHTYSHDFSIVRQHPSVGRAKLVSEHKEQTHRVSEMLIFQGTPAAHRLITKKATAGSGML
jgi:hypothetical protein